MVGSFVGVNWCLLVDMDVLVFVGIDEWIDVIDEVIREPVACCLARVVVGCVVVVEYSYARWELVWRGVVGLVLVGG